MANPLSGLMDNKMLLEDYKVKASGAVSAAKTISEDAKRLVAEKTKSINNLARNPPTSAGEDSTPHSVIAGKEEKNTFSYSYPSDPATNSLLMIFYAYNRDKATAQGDASRSSSVNGSTLTPLGTITLPIPANLTDVTSIQYEDSAMGAFGGEFASAIVKSGQAFGRAASATGMGDAITELKNGAKSIGGEISGNWQNIGKVLLRRTASNIAPNYANVIDQSFGDIPNPNMSVMFRGVNLKTHEYSWKISPNSADEAEVIRKLINTLRSNALPKRKNNYFLEYPSLVDLFLLPNEFATYKHKTCMIESVAVNYAPTGQPVFFYNEYPAEVELTVRFKETSIFTSEDYQTSDN